MFGRKKVNEVFTPRNSKVNPEMYVDRPKLEKLLLRSINGSMHSFLFGESGSGKTWMYKNLFNKEKINYTIANCANMARRLSVEKVIFDACVNPGTSIKVSYSETKKAGINGGIAKGEVSHKGEYEISSEDILITAYKNFGSKDNQNKSVIVLDNLEAIFTNQDLMDELAAILILSDDDAYAQYNIKLLIVGTPTDVIRYFDVSKNSASVSNRIEEIERVSALSLTQVSTLVEKGFINLLKVEIGDRDLNVLAKHVHNITLGIPQRVHEYCEGLAYIIEDASWEFALSQIPQADKTWLLKGLRESYALIESKLNSSETVEGRRNQVIYAIGKLKLNQFNTDKVGNMIRKEFPDSTLDSNSGIGQILSSLTKSDTPLLKNGTAKNSYTLIDPRHLMCIRVMLAKYSDINKVYKRGFDIA